jgi:hypothetical protein
VSNPYGRQLRIVSQQTEPSEIRRKNRQTRDARRGTRAANRSRSTLTHLHHPFTIEM